MSNPFDALDKPDAPAAGNPFDAFDNADDTAAREKVESDPSFRAIVSQFARNRLDGISAEARKLPTLDSVSTLEERDRAKFVRGELDAATAAHEEASRAYRDIQSRDDRDNLGRATEAMDAASRRLAFARELDQDVAGKVVRTATPQQLMLIDKTITEQIRRVDYYESLIEQGDGGEDVKRNLEREKSELIKLEAAREHARQRVADPNRPLDPSAVADVVGGIGQGMGSTFPSLMGAAGERIGQDTGNVGLTEIGRILREYGEGNRRDSVPAPKFSDLSIGKEGFGRDVRRFLATSLGEGVGTSLPIIATYMAGGAPAAFGGSALLGIGQMQSALKEAFAQEGLELPPDKAAWYVYTYGTAIGMLESLTEVWGLRGLTGEAKKRAAKSIAAAMAKGAAVGAASEGVTEGLQEIIEIYGVSNATGKPIDWDEARRRLIDATAAGAVPGTAFGTVSATGQRKHAFDLALEKAKELGFDVQPQTPAALPGGAPEITPPQDEPPKAPAEAAQTLPEPQPATAGPQADATTEPQPSTLPPALEPMADAIDAILPDGIGVDRQMFDKPVGDLVAETVAAVTGEPMAVEAAPEALVPAAPLAPEVQAQAEQIAAQPAPEQFLRQYIAEGGSLSRSALPELARRMAVTEQQLAQVMDEAVKRGELRKTAGGMYRRAAQAQAQAAPSMFKLADSHRQANDAIDEALNFGRQILPRGVQVGVRPGRIYDTRTGLEIDGQFDPSAGRIVLSAYAMQPKGVLAHEGLHVLVKQGQMTLDEVVILANHARKTGAFSPEIEQAYRQAYAGRANMNLAIDEEAAAHLIAARVNGADFGKQINAIIDRILQVLERIANALKGRGFKSVDDVVNALVTGEMAQREPSAPDQVRQFMAQEDLTAMAVRSDSVMFAFAGERARTADLKALARARRMMADRADRTQVWNETGWFQGVDGKWRYEIDDSLAEYLGGVKRARRFDRAIDHPDLAAAYPDLGAAPVRGVKPSEEMMGMVAAYNPLTKEFALRNAPEFDAKTKSSGLHEAQHFIQGKEGFAQGANEILARGHLNDQSAADQIAAHEAAIADKPTGLRYFSQKAWQDYYSRLADTMTERMKARREAAETPRSRREIIETYRRFAGEVESRLVQKRMDMTADERRARPPWLDYDVPEDQQIVRMSDDVMFSLVDASTGQSMRRDLDALGYYSQALEAAKGLKQAKGTPEQMLAQMKAAGVKDAEIEATGLRGFLEGKRSVSKAEIATFLDQNRVALKEVRGGATRTNAELDALADRITTAIIDAYPGMPRRNIENVVDGWRWSGVERDQSPEMRGISNSIRGLLSPEIKAMVDNLTGSQKEARWSAHSLDPSNPSYRETVLHLPKNEGFQTFEAYRASLPPAEQRYPEANIRAEFEATRPLDNFHAGHFPEPNIIGHMMTSMVKHEGKPVYLIDQIQSDWGQKLRDGGVRDEAKIATLKEQETVARAQLDNLVRSHIQDVLIRDADKGFKEVQWKIDGEWYPYGRPVSPLDLYDDPSGFSFAARNAGNAIPGYREAAATVDRLQAERITAEGASPGNPLVNTTDQWVNTTLRRAIRQAAEADAQYIAIPSGKTVLSYNPGDEAGMEGFYNGIVPKNLRNLLRKIDKASPDPIRTDKLETPTQGMKGEGFTVFPLTDKVKQSVMSEGQPMFALNLGSLFRRDQPLSGLNTIIRDLAHDVVLPIRQGLITDAAKKAKKGAKQAGIDLTSYYDPKTGVLRVTRMSDLSAVLGAVGEALIRRFDKMDQWMKGPGKITNPLENLIMQHQAGWFGQSGRKALWGMLPSYSGQPLVPILRDALATYLHARHAYRILLGNAWIDPTAVKAAERALTNAQRQVVRYNNKNLDAAISAELVAMRSFPMMSIAPQDFADYVDIRYNPSSKITPPVGLVEPLERGDLYSREAFAQWFRGYMLDPASTRMQDPEFFDAFEDLIDRLDPTLSAKLDDSQAAIAAHAKAQPREIINSMIKSPKRVTQMQEWFRQVDRDGLLPTLADWVRTFYRGGWEIQHPYYMAVQHLLNLHQINTGKRLDLKVVDNAYKMLRLAPANYAAAGSDIEHGVANRFTEKPEGPSLVGALKIALGTDRVQALDLGKNGRYQKFRDYLVSRRAIRLWERFEKGELKRPPVSVSKDTVRATIQGYEAEHPEFMAAAEEVYEYQRNLLKLQRDAGLISPSVYDMLIKDASADYVPFMRDMNDKGKSARNVINGSASSIIKKIEGSDRDIWDPIVMIAQKTYETRRKIALNDVGVALLKQAEAAGPGGGYIAERLDPNRTQAMTVNIKDALRAKANEVGLSRNDAHALADLAQEMLGADMTATVFMGGKLKPGAEPIIFVFENGEMIPVRLGDHALGQKMFLLISTFGHAHLHWILQIFTLPARLVRATITKHPSFIIRNGIVDGPTAYFVDRDAKPWVTQLKGFSKAIRNGEDVKEYARSAEMMGGEAVTALDKLRFDQDVKALILRGYQVSVWQNPAQWAADMMRHPIRNLSAVTEASETGTRLRMFQLAKERALKNGLNEREAVYEAAFYARDYMDYSRMGSVGQWMAKFIPFFNAAMQGEDKAIRMLMAKGDYGSAWIPYLQYRIGQSPLTGALSAPALVAKGMVGRVEIKPEDAPRLTQREREELGRSAEAWATAMFFLTSITVAAVFLRWMSDDDERFANIPQEIRDTHWVFFIDKVVHLVPKQLPWLVDAVEGVTEPFKTTGIRIPKPFGIVMGMANLVERSFEGLKGDGRWFENYMRGLWNTMFPPTEPSVLRSFYEGVSGKNFYTGRDIVPQWKAGLDAELMYDEYSSEFGKWLGKKTGTSPYYIDHALKGVGTMWAQDMLSLNVPGLPWYNPNKPERSLDDYFIARRFLWREGKGAVGAQKVREIMGPGDPVRGVWDRLSTPYSKLSVAAKSYKEYLDRRDPASATEYLDRLKPNERGYAVMEAHLDGDASKYAMVHPMHRADRVLREISGLQKEILADLVESKKKVGKKGELIPLDPSEKRAALDALTQFQMMEAHNALVLTGELGWDKRAYFDSASVLAEMKAAVPAVAEEFERRMKKANVLPFAQVQQVWPKLKETIEAPEFAALSKAEEKREIRSRIRSLYGEAR